MTQPDKTEREQFETIRHALRVAATQAISSHAVERTYLPAFKALDALEAARAALPVAMPERECATWIQGVMFAAAIIRSNGEEVTAQDLVNHIGLDELKKGICAEQDEETYQWLEGINHG